MAILSVEEEMMVALLFNFKYTHIITPDFIIRRYLANPTNYVV